MQRSCSKQRNHQLGTRVVDELDVARILGHVWDEHGLLVKRGVPDEARAQLHPRDGHLVAVADGDFHLELLTLLVEEQDAERAVVHKPARQRGDTRQQFVEIEDRGEFPADLRERFERAGVLTFMFEQPGVLDADCDVRRKLPQHQFVGFCELACGVAQQIERADDATLPAQRDDQLRVRSGNGLDVPRIGVDIVDENRPSFGNRGADQSVAHFQLEPSGVLGIAD